MQKLTVSEQVMLLAIDDKTGKVRHHQSLFKYGLAGANLLDLIFMGKITFKVSKKYNAPIEIIDKTPIDDRFLDTIFEIVKAHKGKTRILSLLGYIGRKYKSLHSILLNGLVDRGLLKPGFKKLTRSYYQIFDLETKEQLLRQVEDVILYDAPLTRELTSVLTLIYSSYSISLLPKELRKTARKKLPKILDRKLIDGQIYVIGYLIRSQNEGLFDEGTNVGGLSGLESIF